jgi:excisionase family DNA binding protein
VSARPVRTAPDDRLVAVRRQAAIVQQQCAALAREAAALATEVTELVERPSPAPLSVSVDEAARLIGVGRSTMFSLLEEGHIRSVKVGARRLVPRRALEEFLAERDVTGAE